MRRRYPELTSSLHRITGQVAGCMVVTIIVRYLNIWVYDQTLFWGYVFPPEGYLYNIFIGLLYVMIGVGLYEAFYYFNKWKQVFSEKEALKREHLQTQLDSLKTQINPHFLFNNLGSLASLIMEDQQKAVDFVQELSSVFRYLLQANEAHLTTLQQELEFMKHYLHLLQTRFPDSLLVNIDIDPMYMEAEIPPLTLQLLIENAVKHNTLLPQRPLKLSLYTNEASALVVVNNLQPKTSRVISNKLGLQNIKEKYRLLNLPKVKIEISDVEFKVTLPLINSKQYERIDR
jgi:LytS/YehU family sensor histidine kinase